MKTIKASSNQSKKTFTLRVYINNELQSKYRTLSFNKVEFEDMKCNTNKDWLEFLGTDQYYTVF